MPASHPALKKHDNAQWRDVHFANSEVRCTRYEVVPKASTATAQLAEVGGAVQAVVQDAFDSNQPLRVPGGRWSLSTIGKPKSTLLDLSNYRRLGAVPSTWLTEQYTAAATQRGVSAMLIAAGMTINAVNRELAGKKLALQTSGASDGQTFAGAIATGTHGADMKVGALHDTVLALHLVVSPTRSVLVQAASGGLNAKSAETLAKWFGIPCDLLSDDQLFRAARVHLGSLGVVLNVIVEAVPLYYLTRQRTPHREGASWRAVLRSRRPKNANALHPEDPDCLGIILHPYIPHPETDPKAWIISMRKLGYAGQADVTKQPSDVSLKSDLADFLPGLVSLFESHIELPINPILRAVTSSQLKSIYGAQPAKSSALPGAMFGPPDFLGIDFDPLRGASAEYVFNATQARSAVETILDTLAAQVSAGNQYLGGVGVRFVKGSDAWLAPNAKQTNCFVELQSLYTSELPAIHTAIGRALGKAGIPYCGHWGQWAMNTPAVVKSWWGESAAQAWKAARADLLPTAKARKIFASPILAGAGLD
jgi:FAD/FMN-containing dehydrogenase